MVGGIRRRAEGVVQIWKVRERAIPAVDDLVQVGRVGEGPQPLDDPLAVVCSRRNSDVDRGAQLDTSDANPAAMEAIERSGGVLVLDREVAAVEADLDVIEQRALRLVQRQSEL